MTWWMTHQVEMDVLLLPVNTCGTIVLLMGRGRHMTATTLHLLMFTGAIVTTMTTVVGAMNVRAKTGTRVPPIAFCMHLRTGSGSIRSQGMVAIDIGAPSTEVVDTL